jgi:hypothetical protein
MCISKLTSPYISMSQYVTEHMERLNFNLNLIFSKMLRFRNLRNLMFVKCTHNSQIS